MYWSLNPYSHNSDLSLCWSSNIKLDLVNMKIRLCTKAKLYSVREVNDFYFSIGYASGFNLHERSDLAHFPGALQSIWSRLHLSVFIFQDQILFQLPPQVEYKSHLEMISLVAAPPSHRRSDNSTTHGSILFSISHLSRWWAPVHKSENLYKPCPATCFLYNQVKT